jgi:hypothetical protein
MHKDFDRVALITTPLLISYEYRICYLLSTIHKFENKVFVEANHA